MNRSRLLTYDQITWAWHKRKEGYSLKQIADALHVAQVTIQGYLYQRYGTRTPTKPKLVPPKA